MTDSDQESLGNAAESQNSASSRLSSGNLAHRTTTWTINALATGVILIAALVFGRETVQWWRTTDRSSAEIIQDVVSAVPSDVMFANSLLEFGDTPGVLARATIVGDESDAVRGLSEQAWPALERPRALSEIASEAEKKVLAGTTRLKPVAENANGEIYALHFPLPMVTAVANPRVYRLESSSKSVDASRRVVSWGIAFPDHDDSLERTNQQASNGSTTWTLYTFSRDVRHRVSLAAGRDTLVPPGATRTMSLESREGSCFIGIRGKASSADWREYFDQQAQWEGLGNWQGDRRSWRRRFVSIPPVRTELDVQILTGPTGLQRGLLVFTSADSDSADR